MDDNQIIVVILLVDYKNKKWNLHVKMYTSIAYQLLFSETLILDWMTDFPFPWSSCFERKDLR